MKKKRLLTAASLLIMLSVTACGKSAEETANTAGAPKDETTVSSSAAKDEASEAVQPEETGAKPDASDQDAPITADRTEHISVILDTVRSGISDPDTWASEAQTQHVEISLDEETAAKYPELAKSLSEYNKKAADAAQAALDELSSSYDEMKELGSAVIEDTYLSDEYTGSVLRADSNVVSVFLEYSSYWGGAHGMYGYSGVNFDTKTGKELLFTDVVRDTGKYFELVQEKIPEQYPDVFEYLTDAEEYVSGIDLNDQEALSWSIDSEGVTVYFNPYTLGAYVMGAQIISVHFDEAPEIFEESYTETPDSYVIPCNTGFPLFIDADGDGEREALEIFSESDGYDHYSWIVNSGKRSVTVDDYCYSEDSYVVRANSQYYLYIFETSDNDYRLLATVDLKTMLHKQEKNLNAGPGILSQDWTETEDGFISRSSEYGFSDPTDFELRTRLDTLSTMEGSRRYHTGSDGYPVSDDEWFMINTETILQAKMDVACEQVDQNGNVISETTLPKDTYVFFVRTDGSEWVDVQEIDESMVIKEDYDSWIRIYTEEDPQPDYEKPVYRIHTDFSMYPGKVNGTVEDLVFDGIMYAG